MEWKDIEKKAKEFEKKSKEFLNTTEKQINQTIHWVTEDYYRTFTFFTISAFAVGACYRFGWKRFTNVDSLPPRYWTKQKTLKGVVTSVGDGDGFHFYHTPYFRWYLPIPKKVTNQTISVRIAGVDAPECAHFGQPGQPFGEEAKEFLTKKILNKRVKIKLLKKDQYNRAVSMSWVKGWFFWRNISLTMAENGYATLYTSAGAEYGGIKAVLERAEALAKKQKLGMWSRKSSNVESPMQFKKRMKEESGS